MKLLYLGLVLTLGAATAVCPAGSSAQESKKRKTPEPAAKNSENESPKAKKARTSPAAESEAKAASASASTAASLTMSLDDMDEDDRKLLYDSTSAAAHLAPMALDKPDKQDKIAAAASAAFASASAAPTQPAALVTDKPDKREKIIVAATAAVQPMQPPAANVAARAVPRKEIREANAPGSNYGLKLAIASGFFEVVEYMLKNGTSSEGCEETVNNIPDEPTRTRMHAILAAAAAQNGCASASASASAAAAPAPKPMLIDRHSDSETKTSAANNATSASSSASAAAQPTQPPAQNASVPLAPLTEATQKFQGFIDEQIKNGTFYKEKHYAGEESTIYKLVLKFEANGADLLRPWGPDNQTLMHKAAQFKHADLIQYLATKYPQLLDMEDASKQVPLQIALNSSIAANLKTYKALLSRFALEKILADKNRFKSHRKQTVRALHSWWLFNNNEISMNPQVFLNKSDNDGLTPNQFTTNFKKLMETLKVDTQRYKKDILRVRSNTKQTILHALARHGTLIQASELDKEFPEELQALSKNVAYSQHYNAVEAHIAFSLKPDVEFVTFLIKLGTDINHKGKRKTISEKTALQLAIERGYFNIVKRLLKHGASSEGCEAIVNDIPNEPTRTRMRAILAAAAAQNGSSNASASASAAAAPMLLNGPDDMLDNATYFAQLAAAAAATLGTLNAPDGLDTFMGLPPAADSSEGDSKADASASASASAAAGVPMSLDGINMQHLLDPSEGPPDSAFTAMGRTAQSLLKIGNFHDLMGLPEDRNASASASASASAAAHAPQPMDVDSHLNPEGKNNAANSAFDESWKKLLNPDDSDITMAAASQPVPAPNSAPAPQPMMVDSSASGAASLSTGASAFDSYIPAAPVNVAQTEDDLRMEILKTQQELAEVQQQLTQIQRAKAALNAGLPLPPLAALVLPPLPPLPTLQGPAPGSVPMSPLLALSNGPALNLDL